MTRPPQRGYHRCPCNCGGLVPDRTFSCRSSWVRLPWDIRDMIVATRHDPLTNPARAEIVAAAVDYFRTHPTTKGRP